MQSNEYRGWNSKCVSLNLRRVDLSEPVLLEPYLARQYLASMRDEVMLALPKPFDVTDYFAQIELSQLFVFVFDGGDGFCVNSMVTDKALGDCLFVQMLYGRRPNAIKRYADFLIGLAREVGVSTISCEVHTPAMERLIRGLGFKKSQGLHILEVERYVKRPKRNRAQ